MEQANLPHSSSEEKRLYDAALNNNVATLIDILAQDANLLEKTNFQGQDMNPLHIAVMKGNVEFVQEILNYKGSFCMCLGRDRDGRNPLHLAAMFGKLEVLKVLIEAAEALPAALEKADGGGTILHLCVKYNQLEALKILAPKLEYPDFQNAKNEDGMTILHLAINYKQIEITKYLLEEGRVWVNVANANGKTALDLLKWELDNGKFVDEFSTILQGDLSLIGWYTTQSEWYRKSREAIMVVASLIATIAFQAGVSPPGGVWLNDSTNGTNPHMHSIGKAVMAQTHPKYYSGLVWMDSLAFGSALTTIILFVHGPRMPHRYIIPLLQTLMYVSLMATAVAYAIALWIISPKSETGQVSLVGGIVIIVTVLCIGWLMTAFYDKGAKLKARARLILNRIHNPAFTRQFYQRIARQIYERIDREHQNHRHAAVLNSPSQTNRESQIARRL